MKDDLEHRLDDFYRSLGPSARRVEARWRTRRPVVGRPAEGARLLAAGIASAASILLLVFSLRSEKVPPMPRPERLSEIPVPAEDPTRGAPPSPPPVPQAPRPSPMTPEPPSVSPSRRAVAPPAEDSQPPALPAPAPHSDPPPRGDPGSTRVTEAGIVLRQTEGSFDLADRMLRGRQRNIPVMAGDRLRATSLVKITLAEERVILLAPRTVVDLQPDPRRLSILLEQGELLADLAGPGPRVSVASKGFEITPTGTVFDVKSDPGRVTVIVERGRVNVKSAKGSADVRAAESLQGSEDGSLGTPGPADFKSIAWARGQRAPETSLFVEDFTKPGPWSGEIEKGVARAAAPPGGGAPLLHLSSDRPIFDVPVRGSVTLHCRADRAGKIKIQFFLPELRTTYVRTDIPVLRGASWRPVTVDLDEFIPSDKTRPARMPPGSPVTDIVIMYGDDGEKGSFWVNLVKVTEMRP